MTVKVYKIIDGDTFHALVNEEIIISIRLADIECPNRGYLYYKEAKEKLISLLSEYVDISFVKRDAYNRIVANVFVNEQNISEELVRTGFAINFEKYSNSTILPKLQEKAQKQNLGIWSTEDTIKKQYIFQKKLTSKK